MADDKLKKNILQSGEIEFFVQNLQPSEIENVGTPLWFEAHHRLQKLSQQSAVEADEMREEYVKELIISYGKVPVLIHEAICIQVWREKIFSHIIESKCQLQNTFIPYIILFHEITAVSLLQNVLYHKDSLRGAEEAMIDLIDYCASEIIRLLSEDLSKLLDHTVHLSTLEEIQAQSKTIGFNIGMSSICILRYLIEFIDELPISAISRVYKTHDVPLLLTSLIQMAPWRRTNPKTNMVQVFEDRSWKNIDKLESISKYEAQCWIALRFLVLNVNGRCHYEINDFRKQHLIKVQKYLNEKVIDQIPPLVELSQFLNQLALITLPCHVKKPLLMETIPEIKTNIIKEYLKNKKKIMNKHTQMIFNSNKEEMMEIAKRSLYKGLQNEGTNNEKITKRAMGMFTTKGKKLRKQCELIVRKLANECHRNVTNQKTKNKRAIIAKFRIKSGRIASLGETYDLDHLERLSPEGPMCSNCGDAASKRCSKCKNEWYCGRECQVMRWKKHKNVCDIVSVQGNGDH